MNKIGLKIRAVVITTVYNKALSVSLTTLSAFSSGEVCEKISIKAFAKFNSLIFEMNLYEVKQSLTR